MKTAGIQQFSKNQHNLPVDNLAIANYLKELLEELYPTYEFKIKGPPESIWFKNGNINELIAHRSNFAPNIWLLKTSQWLNSIKPTEALDLTDHETIKKQFKNLKLLK